MHGTGLHPVDAANTRVVSADDLYRIGVIRVGCLVPKDHGFSFLEIEHLFATMPVSRNIEHVAKGLIKPFESFGDAGTVAAEAGAGMSQRSQYGEIAIP